MASLKEIKGRIGSVEGTLKITSAMKMVASAKLHKAQQAIEGMLPYDRQLNRIMTRLVSGGVDVISPLSMERKKKQRVAVVCVASNSSLCGSYNSNATRHTV
ncbi:MAG: F0F1 ATP synthase subunit gamma [Bacteroidaceae bacterium]|nr:F0F1 ATP synthase subunit gamma [Bacteroidaceae bacterium]